MKQTSGQSLNEFAILMAVIAVVCLAAYTALGNNINQLLSGSLTKFKGYDPPSFMKTKYGGSATSTSTPSTPSGTLASAGQWGGTPSTPVSNCVSGSCSIDFGNYILNGVPESLDQVVKSTGSSGANEKMYDLFMQLSDQLATEGKAAESQDFKDMANLAKYMASLQKMVENNVASCGSITDPASKTACYSTNITSNEGNSVTVPPELASLLAPAAWANVLDSQLQQAVLGNGRSLKATAEGMYTPDVKNFAGYAFIEKFDKIMNTSSVPSNLKGLAKELYTSVADINEEFYQRKSPYNSMPMGGANEYDPISGAFIQLKTIFQTDFLNPTLNSSNISSSLTCGSTTPSASTCHQNL